MGYEDLGTQDLYVSEMRKLKQALAEKDAQLSKAGEEIAYLNMRVDAIRRWLSKKISTGEAKDAAYQQLMEKAVRFADMIRTERECTYGGYDAAYNASSNHRQAYDFLTSPEVQAWNERKP